MYTIQASLNNASTVTIESVEGEVGREAAALEPLGVHTETEPLDGGRGMHASGRRTAGRGRAARTRRAADMDLRLTSTRSRGARGAACLHAGAGGGCSGRVSIGGRGAGGGARGRAGRPASVRLGAASARSSPVPAVRRAGVSPRAPGGGGEPRAARPRADVARSRSAPSPAPRSLAQGRRARSLAACRSPSPPSAPAPRLRPVFLWARQRDGTVQEVRCEDYDPRNRIRIARTPAGWRVIPRTATYDSIHVPAPPPRAPRERTERRRRRRCGSRRRRPDPLPQPAHWFAPDLESHIPSHTIAVPRVLSPPAPSPSPPQPPPDPEPAAQPDPVALAPPPSPPRAATSPPLAIEASPPRPPLGQPPPPEPTPLDNLLAVAELEFNQQRGEEALELELQAGAGAQYAFLPDEEVARDVMSFELGESKAADDMFFERKTHSADRSVDDDAFQNDIVAHKDLFDTINEAHYLPELSGPHDEELLESLVEKGCEDNQILGQALDKLAHLVHGSGEYVEEEEDLLLSGAPVADIIDRLEQSLESPSRSSITAAQGLLHLHHIGDHLPARDHQPDPVEYMEDEVFAPEAPSECPLEALSAQAELGEVNEVNHYDYDQNAEKRLQSNGKPAEEMYTEQVPDLHETYEDKEFEDNSQTSEAMIEQTDVTMTSETNDDGTSEKLCDEILPKIGNKNIDEGQNENTDQNDDLSTEQNVLQQDDLVTDITEANNDQQQDLSNIDLMKELDETCIKMEEPVDAPTDLSIKNVDDDVQQVEVASVAAETCNAAEDGLSDKGDEQPKDLSIHRRLPTPHASPRIEIPRAPSRESDAMQSPQPSGIPAISSPEVFNVPASKSKQFLESLYASTSPKMYTSEVTITKQQCEPLNLGKHRKSASPTVSSCSDEIRKPTKDYGEPQEKRSKRDSMDDLNKITKLLNKCNEDKITELRQKKPDKPIQKPIESDRLPSPLKQLEDLKSNKNFNIPDPLLVPKDKLNDILMAPGIEIPALLMQRPELRLPEIFEHPNMMRDPDILVISLSQLENIMGNDNKHNLTSPKPKEPRSSTAKSVSSTEPASLPAASTTQPDQTAQPKPIPAMGGLDEIDAATSAALNQMLWLPYLNQLEAMASCSQNMDFIKALNQSGYSGVNYAELSQMLNHQSRFMNPAIPMMPPMDYDSRVHFAMWQEAMSHNSTAASQRKPTAMEAQMKELAAKANEFQSPYVHSTKNQNKSHSAARTSPITNNYTNNQRAMPHNPFLQNMYPGMNPNVRPNVPLPGLQIPYFNSNLMGSQRSPRTSQQKSPTSPYFPNNNYLHSVKQSEGSHQRSRSSSSQESPRPRISVKSLQELQQTAAASSAVGLPGPGGGRRASAPGPAGMAALGRRRDERDEVGSTTPLGEPHHLPPHPHDPATFHLWHPLFGNQKGYTSPWSWTTVTATGD